jgi:aerobic carbon-monoxide dehydrogenase small subunit
MSGTGVDDTGVNATGVNEPGGGVSGSRGGDEAGATEGGGRRHAVAVTVNGRRYERRVEPRLLLSDFLRHDLGLTGTHVGCEHGVCGACTVLLDGEAVRSCLLLAVQADGHEVTTVEALAPGPEELHPLQEAFRECHALQCGFCTPGFLMTLVPFLRDNPRPSDDEIRHALSGNLCRCTGYQNIVAAVRLAAAAASGEPGDGD